MVGGIWCRRHVILYFWLCERIWVCSPTLHAARTEHLTWNRVYQEYYETHQLHDQTPSAISWIGSIQIFFLFCGALFGGPLFDQFGGKVSLTPISSNLPIYLHPNSPGHMATSIHLSHLRDDDQYLQILLPILPRPGHPRRLLYGHDHGTLHVLHWTILSQKARGCHGTSRSRVLPRRRHLADRPEQNDLQPPPRLWMGRPHLWLYHASFPGTRMCGNSRSPSFAKGEILSSACLY